MKVLIRSVLAFTVIFGNFSFAYELPPEHKKIIRVCNYIQYLIEAKFLSLEKKNISEIWIPDNEVEEIRKISSDCILSGPIVLSRISKYLYLLSCREFALEFYARNKNALDEYEDESEEYSDSDEVMSIEEYETRMLR
ncbi:hypothetical protein FACS1894113_2900 [Alphaproteobacteria bacterium]|nr:hypothetical protein FACS1894113_2900 [Alphaproteobacteria bacterium]